MDEESSEEDEPDKHNCTQIMNYHTDDNHTDEEAYAAHMYSKPFSNPPSEEDEDEEDEAQEEYQLYLWIRTGTKAVLYASAPQSGAIACI